MDDVNESRLRELKAQYGMNNLGLWLTWTTTGRDLRALDARKSYGF